MKSAELDAFRKGLPRNSLKEFLIAYDFSDAAETCLRYAILLSKRFGSYVHLVNIQNPRDYASLLDSGPEAMELSLREAQADLSGVRERLRQEGIESDAARRIGNPADVLGAAILASRPDLLFLGAFGHGATDRITLGSTAEHVLRTAPCPVFTVGPNAIAKGPGVPPIKRILFPSSSIDQDGAAIDFAGWLALNLGAALEIIHIVDREYSSYSNAPVREHAENCERWAIKLRALHVETTWNVKYGLPEEVIAQQASEGKSSLIIFGLHRTGSRMVESVDGVVSASIRRAHCPVLTIPVAPDAGRLAPNSIP